MSAAASRDRAGAPASLSLVIPAFNEQDRLGPTLARVSQWLSACGRPAEVVVVDDGSLDQTEAVVAAAAAASPVPVRLERNPRNLGKGASVRRGVLAARHEIILFSDADLSTPIEESDKLLAAIEAGHDLAIGSRAAAGARIEVRQAWYRELMGKGFNLLVRLLAGTTIRDTQCGFKAFRATTGRELFRRMRVDRFGFDVELLFLAERAGLSVAEIPVIWRNSPNSRVNPLTDSTRMAWDLLLIRARAALGRYGPRAAGIRSAGHKPNA